MIIKCKMCGGDMEISADQRTGTCEYCGSTMTLPKIDDEQRAAAFNRGNHFRRIGEFDKALAVYEGIVREDENDAEAHWCCALCRFGIEYVKDPASGEYLPTCHRASFDSFLEDVDYKAALEHADVVARAQYQKDGEKIAQVQRGILSISQREQPFDVFICYKESDERGNRTVDSTLAQEIYYQLTDQGRRVFFARITLEDKAGQEYEPYIFAALHSAKVMVVVGTNPEYLNAVWVKNEWSRYLALMKHDRKRLLIPCYRDMDPYDLPEQLSVLQSYDMSRIGFIQDLIRGIAKVLDADKKPEKQEAKETVVFQGEGNVNLAALLKRGWQALEDEEWEKADGFFDQALNIDAECGEAFFGKELANGKKRNRKAFIDGASSNHPLAPEMLTLPDPGQKVIKITAENWREATKEATRLTEAALKMGAAPPTLQMGKEAEACPREEKRIEENAAKYEVPGYLTKEEIRKGFSEGNMRSYISEASIRRLFKCDWERLREGNRNLVRAKQYAKGVFAEELAKTYAEIDEILNQKIREAEERDAETETQIKKLYEEFLQKAEQLAKEKNGLAQARRETDYLTACFTEENANDERRFRQAEEEFRNIGEYKDCKDRAEKCRERVDKCIEETVAWIAKQAMLRKRRTKKIIATVAAAAVVVIAGIVVYNTVIQPSLKYKEAKGLIEETKYDEAIKILTELGDYSDAEKLINESYYSEGMDALSKGNFLKAYASLGGIRGYKDTDTILSDDEFINSLNKSVSKGNEVIFGSYEQDNDSSNGPEDIEWIVLDKKDDGVMLLSKYGLDAQPYNKKYGDTTWENCTLRKWLNDDFLNDAFTDNEKTAIEITAVDNSSAQGYWEYDTTGGNNTQDKIFLLSYKEAFRDYFTNDTSRVCAATTYVESMGERMTDSSGNCYWMLRSPGESQNRVLYVGADGGYHLQTVEKSWNCIRPALWINLESGIF